MGAELVLDPSTGTIKISSGRVLSGDVVRASLDISALTAEALGLMPSGFSPDGTVLSYTVFVSGIPEFQLSPAESLLATQPAHAAPAHKTGNSEVAWGEAKPTRARDGTVSAPGSDWRLAVRPLAVRQCELELRHGFIERKEPATTKAAFREDAHRRAQIIVDGSRGKQGKQGR